MLSTTSSRREDGFLHLQDIGVHRKSGQPTGSGHWVSLLWSIVLLLGSMAWFESSQAQSLRKEVSLLKTDNSALRKDAEKSEQSLQQALAAFHRELDQFHSEFVTSQAETGASISMAQLAALKHADALAKQLENKHSATEAQANQLSAELSKVKQTTADAVSKVNSVSRDVGTVKKDVETVKNVAERADSKLEQTRDNVGMMTGLIATNSSEIEMLRQMGDRNINEFSLTKTNTMQRVGDIQLQLDKTDPKHNRFTVLIQAADQRVEERDKNINEPVQFYIPGKAIQPFELVVNEVGKNSVKGYVASPKVTIARNAGSDQSAAKATGEDKSGGNGSSEALGDPAVTAISTLPPN